MSILPRSTNNIKLLNGKLFRQT